MPKPIKMGRKERMSFSQINEVCEMPNLIRIQTESYDWFIKEGLKEVFEDISPITDHDDVLSLEFIGFDLCDKEKNNFSIEECKERDTNYAKSLNVRVRRHN